MLTLSREATVRELRALPGPTACNPDHPFPAKCPSPPTLQCGVEQGASPLLQHLSPSKPRGRVCRKPQEEKKGAVLGQ